MTSNPEKRTPGSAAPRPAADRLQQREGAASPVPGAGAARENVLAGAPLGHDVAYDVGYDPSLLYPIPRERARAELGLAADRTLPFLGADIWAGYELSWLNERGRPQVAIVRLVVPCQSPNLVESKSLKLYLNGFAMARVASADVLRETIAADLSAAAGAAVYVDLVESGAFGRERLQEFDGTPLDRLDIECSVYRPDAGLLEADFHQQPHTEVLNSNLLRSNCPVTGQPDWGSVRIAYTGCPIDHASLLRYIVSFREHTGFHEQCVERMFMDIRERCQPQRLSVFARYTRRGGLDINPLRSSAPELMPPFVRLARQ